MITLPLPVDVDLSEMPHFPLRHARLLKSKSWRRAKAQPEIGFFMLNTWIAAFIAVPGGSLEDDDDELAEAAWCHPRDWPAVKAAVMRGWVLQDGRWWHPVVAEIVWELWVARLRKRWENAHDSWRAACKRAASTDRPPPEPVGVFEEWLAAKFTASHLYMCNAGQEGGLSPGHPPPLAPREGENPPNFDPKRSEGKQTTPLTPLGCGGEKGLGMADTARARAFGQEVARLERGLGPLANMFKSSLQQPGRKAVTTFHAVLREAEFVWDTSPSRLTLFLPSRARAKAFEADHHAWLGTLSTPVTITWKGAKP